MSEQWPVQDPIDNNSEFDTPSPRSTLLSFEDVEELPRRIPRGPGSKFRHERERAHSTTSQRELLHLLVNEEYESKQTRRVLYTAFERLELETKRAEAAEARIDEVVQRARAINEARVVAEQQAVRAQEELKLYKMQLDNAQKEILRAQDVLKAIEAQRDEAEAAAISARTKARRLNEERLIELAKEEGRRLGFEEGIRRGRRMAYREGYYAGVDHRGEEIAADAVDRFLENHEDEPELIEVRGGQALPIPPPSSSRHAPEVHRIETPADSSLEAQRQSSRSRHDSSESVSRSNSTLRRTPDRGNHSGAASVEPRIIPSRTPSTPTANSRPHSGSQSWAGPPSDPSYGRPSSAHNSSPGTRPIDIAIPPDNYIPTADSHQNISLPPPHEMQRIPSPTPSHRTLEQGPERERGRRDYMYGEPHPRRASPDESLASTKQSAASSISQLDIVGLPPSVRHRDRVQGLSVIHEDASVRSERMTEYSQTAPSVSEGGRNSFREMASSETLRRDRKSRQQLADELRHSDPTTPEQWRRQAESSRLQQPQDAPPRHRPTQITIPTPLSPPRVLQPAESRHRRTASERQGRPETRSEYRDERRRLSSDSSVPEINVEPPSGPPSDAPSRGRGNVPPERGLLSPDHAHQPLPMPGPAISNGRSAPTPGSPGRRADELYNVLPDGQGLPGMPTSSSSGRSQRYSVPYGAPSSERETGRSKSPISFYAASAVPAGVTYPAPPISRSAGYGSNAYSSSNPSLASEGRKRRDSLSASAGVTPSARTRPVQTAGSADSGGGHEGRSRRQSTSGSTGRPSYARYNPGVYNDPAYLASSESFMDSVTDANTAANGGGGVARPVRVNVDGSPAYAYVPLRE